MNESDDISFDDIDEILNPKPPENDFDRIVQSALSRRQVLKSVLAIGGVATLGGVAEDLTRTASAAESRFTFDSIAANTLDTVTVPEGFSVKIVVRWGDPLWSGVDEFDAESRGTAESQQKCFGDNNDGMEIFTYQGKTILVVNNEYTNRKIIWGNRKDSIPASEDDLLKGKMAHGLTVVEITQRDGDWSVVKDSPFNRRVTPDTPMKLTGPAAGHSLLKTAADPSGFSALGTWNNCGNGSTPWGTYLACEENFNGYFSAEDPDHKVPIELRRYGVSGKDWGYGWVNIDERFDVSKHPNEPNRVGYVVEIDPLRPEESPRKLTALGRFKHENA